jgi:flagellar biogenesis protein FliO
MIKELFAWTIVIITISILFEWLVMRILSRFPFNKNEKDKT